AEEAMSHPSKTTLLDEAAPFILGLLIGLAAALIPRLAAAEPPSAKALAVRQLALGQDHGCALFENGQVRCWGKDGRSELIEGIGANQPRAVEVAAGSSHSCARLGDGTVRCWGANSFGQLGDGGTSRGIARGSQTPREV